jgi:hypothetical protein
MYLEKETEKDNLQSRKKGDIVQRKKQKRTLWRRKKNRRVKYVEKETTGNKMKRKPR